MAGALAELNAWLENKRRVAKRNLADILGSPEDYGRMAAARTQQNMEEAMSDPTAGLNFVGGPLGGLAGVIKPKGGNWMPGAVETALDRLKTNPNAAEQLATLSEMHPQSVLSTFAPAVREQIERGYRNLSE